MTYTDVTSGLMDLVMWLIRENPSACGGLGCAAGRWMTPDPSLKGWLLKDGGQLWHQQGHFGALNQLPQHNPSQRWSQSSQRSPSLIITYSMYITERDHCPPAKQVKLIDWLILWLRSKKSVKMESEIYLTKQTLISWLSALIPWCFSSWSFMVYITALFFQALFSSFPSSSAHTEFPRWPNEHAGQ